MGQQQVGSLPEDEGALCGAAHNLLHGLASIHEVRAWLTLQHPPDTKTHTCAPVILTPSHADTHTQFLTALHTPTWLMAPHP